MPTKFNIDDVSKHFKAILLIIVLIIIIYVAYKILKKTGFIKTAAQRKVDKEIDEQNQNKKLLESQAEIKTQTSDLFDIKQYGHIPREQLLSDQEARDQVVILKYNLENFVDFTWISELEYDLEAILNVFKALSHKSQVTQLAFAYQADTGKDLGTRLSKVLTKNDLVTLWNIINQIPK
jgi:hypothetical protein